MMTGRELIVYILTNGLEDEPIYKDGTILGFMNELEAAVKFNVSTATIRTWFELGMLDGVKIGNVLYIPSKASSPLEKNGGKNV